MFLIQNHKQKFNCDTLIENNLFNSFNMSNTLFEHTANMASTIITFMEMVNKIICL